jgi:DNA polymerase-3 subunit beta
MQFVIQKSDLVQELQTVTGVVEKRATLPILSNLLLEAQSDGLHVRASDLEVSVRGIARAEIVEEGAVTLPAAKLLEIARSLPEAEVQFKLGEGNHVALSCERTRYRLSGQPVDEFPGFPVLESEAVEIPGQVLRRMIERVSFAITTEDPRYTLNGALLHLQKTGVRLVATDGHRLAYIFGEVGLDLPGGDMTAIIPKKALNEVFKLTSDLGEEDKVSFGKEGNHIFFEVAGHELASTVPEGPFPNYENVMPETCGTSVCIPTTELAQAARRVSLLASDRYGKAVRFSLSGGKLELSYEADVGEARETLSVDYDGEGIDIGFNARYIMDFLSVVASDQVRLELDPRKAGESPGKEDKPGDKPGQLRPEPAGDMDYRYIVMPMHLL